MSQSKRPLREKLVWPGIVFMLIGISVTLMSITLFLAVSDQSFGVEDEYYAKAVSWDETAADRAASDALGWTISVSLAPEIDLSGKRAVMVTLTDAEGDPVEASASDVYAFHHARRNDPVEFGLTRIARGRYSAGAPLLRDGVYQLRMRFTSGRDVFLARLNVSTEPSAERSSDNGVDGGR